MELADFKPPNEFRDSLLNFFAVLIIGECVMVAISYF
jgi:hypothetical protein